MFAALKRIVAWLQARRPPSSRPPADPFAGVRAPRTRGPNGGNSAVALMEPKAHETVRAVARRSQQAK